MLKFAPKNNKQILIAVMKERQIFVYKLLLPLAGHSQKLIIASVGKYLLNFHSFFKTFSSFSRSRKNCALTGRSRSIYRMFQLSRMKIREFANDGRFIGITKSS